MCARARAHAFLRECVSVSACVRCYVRVNQCVAPPCTDQKRGPNSRLLLNLIPGRPFTMFSISLYDIRRKKLVRKRYLRILCTYRTPFKAPCLWVPERYRKGFLRGQKRYQGVRGWYLESFSCGGERETESDRK